jgi:hypothetical protein
MFKPKDIKEVEKSPFIKPKVKYYFGRIKYGTPYYEPMNFNSTFIYIRKLKPRSKEDYENIIKDKPWLKERERFTNLPMVRRSKDWIIKILGIYFYIKIGWPIMFNQTELGWKDKFSTPRFEWTPAFSLYLFKWQLYGHYDIESDRPSDYYWEMYLWWKYYSDKDLEKARKTWPWTRNGKSSWDESFINTLEKRDKLLKKLGI